MKTSSLFDRRNVLKTIASAATLAMPGWVLGANSIWIPEDLTPTPRQTEGPFYPQPTIEQQMFNDTDLIRKLGTDAVALGQQCIVAGSVKNQKGKPIQGAVVEVWQACASGRYNHERDSRNPRPLDKNFQFWGKAITGEDGKYLFKTIVPGKYPGRTARHIHYRVDAAGYRRCSTQSFFSDYGEDNMQDGLYRQLDRKQRELLTIEFDKPTGEAKKEAKAETKKAQAASSPAKSDKTVTAKTEGAPSDTPKKKEAFWTGQFDIVLAKK